MILIYTGSGKGKTTAAVGQAIRAHGQGLRVCFAQFMKRPNQAGEQKILSELLGEHFYAGGHGFFRAESTRGEHRDAVERVLRWATEHVNATDMLILDESLYALGSGLLQDSELLAILEKALAAGTHLVLTGRGLPDWLLDRADLVTEMLERKHPYAQGRSAEVGIEF